MPEARDRLTRSNDVVVETYNRRRTTIGRIGIFPDEDESDRNLTPFRWGGTPLTGVSSGQRIGQGFNNSSIITTRGGGGGVSGRVLFQTPMTVNRRGGRNQNTPPTGGSFRRGRGGRTGQRSVLPSWYPRTPLGDITHVVRAIERRRERLGDGVGQISVSPTPIQMDQKPADQDPSSSDVQLEHEGHEALFVTPMPKLALKMSKQSPLGRIPFILTVVAKKCEEEPELQTPQKKLLDSIELVEKVVMQEVNRLRRTPKAKKAEREKRVRTLMSMR